MLVSHDSAIDAARAPVRVRRALVSVYDKQGLDELATTLDGLGIEILSTGGTARALRAAGVPVTPIESVTGFPEILDGRVKTLHPAVHAGILFQRQVAEHCRDVETHGIAGIDLVVLDLYPFAAARQRAASWAELVEYIDVGGPSMARAAAKNFPHVVVVTATRQLPALLGELRTGDGSVSGATRARLAAEAFDLLARYDRTVATALGAIDVEVGAEPPRVAPRDGAGELPDPLAIEAERVASLRYGENPHQRAAFHAPGGAYPGLHIHQGKELSYNNLLDLDACVTGMQEFGPDACIIFKHASPAGVARADTPLAAFQRARDGDPLSAFGGIIGFACTVDGETAAEIARDFYEVVIATGFDEAALAALARKKNLRVLTIAPDRLRPETTPWQVRSALGGYLVQTPDACDGRDVAPAAPAGTVPGDEVRAGTVVSARSPSAAELDDLAFAWRCARLVRSNAIVLARDRRTLGIGGGQASRIDAVEVAALKAARAGHDLQGSVMASDGFFPFRDCIDRAAELGVRAVVHPGGSRRDQESIDAADAHDMALVATGRRHFLH
jgi:phosphoribosylaminoimidazolecarboxamide formyltransferase/IMP cyclohydrolase